MLRALIFCTLITTLFSQATTESSHSLQELLDAASVNTLKLLPRDVDLSLAESQAINGLCNEIQITNLILTTCSYLLPALLRLFGHASHGDRLTGNPFVEGSNEETLVTIKLNRSLEIVHDISLENLQEIFMRLREDITKRSELLKNRLDGDAIIQVLREREERLLHKLQEVERCVFHFRQHPSLFDSQQKIAMVASIATPIVFALLFVSSFDFQAGSWTRPSQELMHGNMRFVKRKLLG